MPRPLYLREMSLRYLLYRRMGALQRRSERGGEEKKSLPLPGSEPPSSSQKVDRRQDEYHSWYGSNAAESRDALKLTVESAARYEPELVTFKPSIFRRSTLLMASSSKWTHLESVSQKYSLHIRVTCQPMAVILL
jgi:hypothetical protein